MFYFQKMKSVLKCLSLSLTYFPPSRPCPSPLLPLPSQSEGYQLLCQEQTTVINFAVHLKWQTLSFLAVFLTLVVGAWHGEGWVFVGALLACHLPLWDQDNMAGVGWCCCCLCFRALGTPGWFKVLLGIAIVTLKALHK